jgi:hypothetical protein
MGEMTIKGINGREHVERLRALLDFILQEGEEWQLIYDDVEWDFTPEYPSNDELDFIVDPHDALYLCKVWTHRWECTCRWDAAHTDPRQGVLVEIARIAEGFYPLVPCSDRGTHQTLEECSMCFADVMDFRAEESDVLAPECSASQEAA